MPDDRFLAAAQSVADSIAALARPAVGGARWETRSYTGKPQYSTAVFGGTAGVVFLFADLFRVTGDPKAREVAEAAAMWVEGKSKADLRDSNADAGLYFGMSGHGLMCLHLYEATGRERWLRDAQARARAVARASWPDAHLLSGSAGSLVFLLRLYQATAEQSALDAAVRAGEHIVRTVTRDDQGARWDWLREDQVRFSAGFVHGASGIAYALAELWRFTGSDVLKDLAYQTRKWIDAVSLSDDRGICWNRWPGDPHRPRVQWCHGAPGIGLFAARAAEVFSDDDMRLFAESCAHATLAAGDVRNNASQCHGLAGNAELFIELARVSGDNSWLAHARTFGDQALAYGGEHDGEVRWLGDEPGNYSPDFMLGSSGLGHFFLRLARPDKVQMPLMVRPSSREEKPT
jgi:lantibiotic modifying enzyme